MKNPDDFQDWMKQALQDLSDAKMYRQHGCAYEVMTFRCHQALEKALKGYVLAVSAELIPSHDLVFLGRNAAKGIPQLNERTADLALVNKHYVEMTYPDDMVYAVSAEIVAECIRITEELLGLVLTVASEQGFITPEL